MGQNTVSNAPGDAGSIDMEVISQDIQILPEDTLQKIGRGPLVKFIHTCDNFEKVRKVFENLRQTFSTASISHSHSAAACNALSAFLDAAFVAKCEQTRQIAENQETWISVFNSFLARYKDTRPRPMKQVLESLVLILARTRNETTARRIKEQIVAAVIPCILLGEPRSQLKASIVAFEMLLRKKAITPIELISIVEDWLLNNQKQWPIVLQEECRASNIDTSLFVQQSLKGGVIGLESKRIATEILVLGFLNRAKVIELAASSGEALTFLFQKLQLSSSFEDGLALSSVWVNPVKHFLLQNLDNLEKLSNYIILRLFTVDPSGFTRFIESLPLKSLLVGDMNNSTSDELTLLFTSLQIGKKIGLVHEDHHFSKSSNSSKNESVLVLKSEFIGQFLFHYDFDIRISALSLLITAPSTTKPLTLAAIRVIIKALPSLHAESDPCSRGRILSLVRKLLVRLMGGVLGHQDQLSEQKITVNKKQQPNLVRDDSETKSCLEGYLKFLMADLRPTASYHRHIMALKTIILLLESGLDERLAASTSSKMEGCQTKWKFNVDILKPALLRLLVDLLLDPFDEVRAASLVILKMFPQSIFLGNNFQPAVTDLSNAPELINALSKAEQLASNTSRADHADTVARLYHIIFSAAVQNDSNGTVNWWDSKSGVVKAILEKLEDKLSLSEGLFTSTMRDAPLHGYLCALRYIVSTPNFYSLMSNAGSGNYDSWRSIHTRISFICEKIWTEVKPVLCIDSPEGHAAEPIEDLAVGPKDILSYSWRALREFSYLLNATLANETYGPEGELGLTREDYEKIGRSSFTQLAELRHRGAFSTVAQTFATCCERCGQSKNSEISSLPLLWYQEAKNIIFESASKLTRRSAGLPALVVGILLSNPGGPLFNQVIQELQEVSHLPAQHDNHQQALELPQVHAMNCLKDIFTNARLGPHTEPFIMSALNLSAERIGSPIWALRNSGLMLFRGLLVRICRNDFQGFGGQSGSEPGARISFPKYPGLIPLLSNLLKAQDQRDGADINDTAMVTERVFPALELIAEKIPNTSEVDDDMLRALVREQLKSPVWGIREHAARVYASLLARSDILTAIHTLLKKRDSETQNYLHGETLCIKYSLRRFACTTLSVWNGYLGEITSTIHTIFAASFPITQSPFIATALLEILSDTVEKSIETGAEEQMIQTIDSTFTTYGIPDVLNYVFDSTNPSWKSLSTTRAFSLLRREVSWVTILRKLIDSEAKDLESFLRMIADFDPNASQWLLERMHEILGAKERFRAKLIGLYTSVIVDAYPAEAKTIAISNLASSFESMFDVRNTEIQSIDLDWEAIDAHLSSISTRKGFNRDRSDATLRLQGCLLTAKSIFKNQQPSETEVLKWATGIRFALAEETEFTTRYAAATSIASFARILRPSKMQPRVDSVFLEIYLSLYDLLNDDDDELREIGSSTASWILSYSSVSPNTAVTISPLNASELFADFLADNYASSALLCTRTIRYMLGQELRIGEYTCKKGPTPISYTLQELRKESTILFEEEKQNLFIEEVREVDVWSNVLCRLTAASYNERLLQETYDWVSEGLSCISEILRSESGEDGPIGWLSKTETYTLAVRVIGLASVLVSKNFTASSLLGSKRVLLVEKLQILLECGKPALLHDDLVSRIQLGLKNS